MNRRILLIFASLLSAAIVLSVGIALPVFAATYAPPAPLAAPDYFGVPNYANSPLPAGNIVGFTVALGGSGYTAPTVIITDPVCIATANATVAGGVITAVSLTGGGTGCIAPQVSITDATGTGAAVSATLGGPFTGGIRKFVDGLPGLCGVTPKNDLKQCIPIAVPDTATFPGSDYYSLAVSDYTQKMHFDLPATKLRGYLQLNAPVGNAAGTHQYLGPMILATKNVPVRIKFTNMLATGNAGDLFPYGHNIHGSRDRSGRFILLSEQGYSPSPWRIPPLDQ